MTLHGIPSWRRQNHNQLFKAHRTLIVRGLKHLEEIVDLYLVGSLKPPAGWTFDGTFGSPTRDPLHPGFTTLRQLYELVEPGYSGRVTVPVLWDKKSGTIVNNESSEILRMFYTKFDDLVAPQYREANRPGGGLFPEPLRSQIDELNEWVYNTVCQLSMLRLPLGSIWGGLGTFSYWRSYHHLLFKPQSSLKERN